MLGREATNTNFIVFGLTRSTLDPMIYRTRGEHANHYTTDAGLLSFEIISIYFEQIKLTESKISPPLPRNTAGILYMDGH